MPTQLVPGVTDMIERINRFVRDVTPDDLSQIPPDRRWTVFVNGHEYLHQDIKSVVLASRFAVMKLGITNAGTYHVRIGEYGGGGVNTLPFIIHKEQLLVGLLRQKRDTIIRRVNEDGTMEGETLRPPGGYREMNKSVQQTALEELAEEAEFQLPADRLIRLPGEPGNFNSGFFTNIIPEDEGLIIFTFVVLAHEVEPVTDGEGILQFKKELLHADLHYQELFPEIFFSSRFYHWTTGIRDADMATSRAVGLLLAFLSDKNIEFH